MMPKNGTATKTLKASAVVVESEAVVQLQAVGRAVDGADLMEAGGDPRGGLRRRLERDRPAGHGVAGDPRRRRKQGRPVRRGRYADAVGAHEHRRAGRSEKRIRRCGQPRRQVHPDCADHRLVSIASGSSRRRRLRQGVAGRL